MSSDASRVTGLSSSSTPLIAGTSEGEGINSITESSMACTPLFLKAEPHSMGTISLLIVLILKPFLISSSDKSPDSKYLFIKSSFASAADSSILSRHFWHSTFNSSLISLYSKVTPLSASFHIISFIFTRSTTPVKVSAAPIGT